MRKYYRALAKARMKKKGYPHINRDMRAVGAEGEITPKWREFADAYPVRISDGKTMKADYHGPRKAKKGTRRHLFAY